MKNEKSFQFSFYPCVMKRKSHNTSAHLAHPAPLAEQNGELGWECHQAPMGMSRETRSDRLIRRRRYFITDVDLFTRRGGCFGVGLLYLCTAKREK